jgi:hypothetical protein
MLDRDEYGRFVAMKREDDNDWLNKALAGTGAGALGYGAAKGGEKALGMASDATKKGSQAVRKGMVGGRSALRKLLRGTSLGKAAAFGGLAGGGLAAMRSLTSDDDDEE